MPRPYRLLDAITTPEGELKLLRRGDDDFMITVGPRVLMTSALTRSELFLAEEGCRRIAQVKSPRVLIGGMGLGFTLRAALDGLPPSAQVMVAELNPIVVSWCRTHAASATNGAALDPRVSIFEGNVLDAVRQAAEGETPPFDAILWDLYVGPTAQGGRTDPLYGERAVRLCARALAPGGVFGVWGEEPSPAFEARLRQAGLHAETVVVGGRGMKHADFFGVKKSASSQR